MRAGAEIDRSRGTRIRGPREAQLNGSDDAQPLCEKLVSNTPEKELSLVRVACVALALGLAVLGARVSTAASAQAAGTASPAQPSIPVTLTLRIAEGRRAFRPGEIIPIELEFTSPVPKRFVRWYDKRPERPADH